MEQNNNEDGNHKGISILKWRYGKGRGIDKKEVNMLSKISILSLCILLSSVYGQVMLNYQGYLTDTQGNPINENVDMTFTIFDAETGGENLWGEIQTDVPVERGIFHVFLGSVEEIEQSIFMHDTDPWLEVTVNGDTMYPREPVSEIEGSIPWPPPCAPDNDWIISGDDMYSGVPGNVGIGTQNPAYDLDIADNVRVGGYLRVGDRVYIRPEGFVPMGYALYVHSGKTQLDTVKFTWDFNSGWEQLLQGDSKIIEHGLGGDPTKYIVYFDGSDNQDGKPPHQANYGTASFRYLGTWYEIGAEWYDLNNNSITVHRAKNDNYNIVPDDKQWDYVRVRILKNQ